MYPQRVGQIYAVLHIALRRNQRNAFIFIVLLYFYNTRESTPLWIKINSDFSNNFFPARVVVKPRYKGRYPC